MGYMMFSDAYRALGKIWYNGDFYDIVEIMSSKKISDVAKLKLINHTLEIEVMTESELRALR